MLAVLLLCCSRPSRNSFMTGRRPHHTNVDGTGTGDDFRISGVDAVSTTNH